MKSSMKVMVIYCHPVPESFNAAVRDEVMAGLAEGGHETRLIDLYADGFQPALTCEERRAYNAGVLDYAPTSRYAEALRWADALVFVYPTWWYNLPAMLKGFIDRVFLPEVAFLLPKENDHGFRDQGIRRNLTHIRKITIVTTCGASWPLSKLIGEPARKTILRGIRSICATFCRTQYLALYRMDSVTERERAGFLVRVRRKMQAF